MTGRPNSRAELEARVLAAIDEGELVALASALIDAGGENPGGTEESVARVLTDTCRRLGFDIEVDEVAPGRPNVVVSIGGSEEPGVLFLGHSDVVPAGGGWSRDPFAATVRDGRLYGRGACDMKGGLAAVVVAMSALKRCGAVGSAPVSLACLVDEEDTGLGIRSFVRTTMRRSYSRCIVAEPTDLMTIVGCRGAANLEITVRGRSAHAGRPSNGRNAISAAARIIVVIDSMGEELRTEAHPVLGAATFNVGTVSGGTGTSMVADCAVITVDRRLLPGEDAHIVAAQLHRRILAAGIIGDGIEVAVDVSMEMPGFLTSKDSGIVQSAVTAVADSAGHHGTDIWTASCDGGFIVRDMGIPAIVLGPGEIELQAHQPDESVSVRQLCDSAAAYALIACRSAALPGVMAAT
ncbi:M20 family peptidase [Rhodococcus sp. PAMC28707]|uniref:M20 family metallopeptidase n=1 Tax=unclassified Rhodococcus (in: high G+C Gram-positive bacteria) TaxID=192944 RepID=UPI00109E1527|nr:MULTISPECIES: M20 family metallopeptidase [unclassified Rhodococcus (in: high G+C Gram-positive bacteria)]QCB51669.1 M20 family peptidase [Rhodococcus sp. PAMC28705]QCB60163.1 M20 family peptidase [Rhodococcus sp. PAMC28707]